MAQTPTFTTALRPLRPRPRIRRTGRYTFEIESRTRPGRTHTQDVLHLKCSCEAGEAGVRCWHIVAALLAEQWCRRIRRKERPARRQRQAPAPIRPAGMAALQEAYS